MNKNTITYIVISVLVFLCTRASAQVERGFSGGVVQVATEIENNTYISGQVARPTDSTILFRYLKNTISFEEETLEVPLLGNNHFALSFKLEEPTVLTMVYGDREIQLFVEPTDDLELRFAGDDFPTSLRFNGKGALHNEYWVSAQEQFADWTSDFIHFEMSRKLAMEFRKWMDALRVQKWQFFQAYNFTQKRQFSEVFVAFAHADIDYWWAYYLLKYRIERPLLVGLSTPMDLPPAYYSFLQEVIISNDKALTNHYYLDFLEEYTLLRQANALPSPQSYASEAYFIVRLPQVLLMTTPNKAPVVAEPQQGDRLQYLGKHSDFKSKSLVDGVYAEDYWYEVMTKDSLVGWVLGVGLERIKQNVYLDMPLFSDTQSKSKIERYIVTKVDNLRVQDTPYDEKSVLATLARNTELTYLLNKTTESFSYAHGGVNYLDYFYKIKTPSGIEGWIPRMGFNFKEREVKTALATPELSSLAETTVPLYRFLNGKALFYAKAKQLYLKTNQYDMEHLGRKIALFRDENPYPIYTKILSAAYEIAQLQGKGDKQFLNTYVYSNLKTPLIEGVRTEMHKQSYTSARQQPIPRLASGAQYVEIDAKPRRRATTPTMISGRVSLPAQLPTTLILYTDPILFTEKRYTLQNTFSYNIHLSEPVTGVLEYGTEKIPIYLEPGDRLEIDAKGNSLFKNISFSGKGSAENQYLLDAQQQFESLHTEMESKVRYADADAFAHFMQKARHKKEQFCDKYLRKSDFSQNFETYIKADITYWYAFQLLNYTVEHPLYHGNTGRMQVGEDYYRFLEGIALSPEGVLPNAHYTYFLKEYLDYQLDKPENKGLTSQDLIHQLFENEAKYYLTAKEMAYACKRGKTLEMGPAIQRFIENCPYESYNDVLRFVYNESKGLIAGTNAPDFTLYDEAGQEVTLSDFKGKVIYMDFWATWCNPCIRSLPHSKKLSQIYAGKDVVFLYISLDEDAQAWRQYLAANDIQGIHLHTNNASIYQSEIAQLYKVRKLPTYILIDKAGKIAYSPAKNPGNSQLLAQINTLLANKNTQ